jgi:hypothetical protein
MVRGVTEQNRQMSHGGVRGPKIIKKLSQII